MPSVEFEFPQGNNILEQLQSIEFEMAVCIKDIFERNHIRYVIEYGSLLGAVRHGGFIPWDDDFDYLVLEDDYEKASNALRVELPKKYILHDRLSDPNYFYSFSKVRHLYSSAIEDGFTDNLKYKGISIDLFKGRIEKNNKYARQLFMAKSHMISHWRKFNHNHSLSELGKFVHYWVRFIMFSVVHFLTPKSDYFHKSPDTDQYFIPLEEYLPLSTVKFNGVDFAAPHNPEYVLTNRYGDWRQYPQNITFHLSNIVFYHEQ